MDSPRISLVVAVARNGVIGNKGQLPWHLPDDLKFFKQTTLGAPIVMGRLTYESIGRPLPGRKNIVISRDTSRQIEGCFVYTTLDQAIASVASDCRDIFIIGGAQLYKLALPYAHRLIVTEVQADVEGDTTLDNLPSLGTPAGLWREVNRQHHPVDERHALSFDFVEYIRT